MHKYEIDRGKKSPLKFLEFKLLEYSQLNLLHPLHSPITLQNHHHHPPSHHPILIIILIQNTIIIILIIIVNIITIIIIILNIILIPIPESWCT